MIALMPPVTMLPSSLQLALSGLIRALQSIHQSIAGVAALSAPEVSQGGALKRVLLGLTI